MVVGLRYFRIINGPDETRLKEAKENLATRPRLGFTLIGLGDVAVRADILAKKLPNGWFLQGRTPRRRLKVEIEYDGRQRTGSGWVKVLPRVERNELRWWPLPEE